MRGARIGGFERFHVVLVVAHRGVARVVTRVAPRADASHRPARHRRGAKIEVREPGVGDPRSRLAGDRSIDDAIDGIARRARGAATATAIARARAAARARMRTRGASGTPARARRARDGAFLTSDAARRLDEDLTAGRACEARSLEALMRAAGRAAATATLDAFGGTDFVVLCGPGNNGGDGLALAREVATRRRDARVSVWYPKGAGTNELYGELVRECRETANVEFVDEDAVLGMMRERATSAAATPRCFVDALFGFSFKGAVRAPFVNVLNALVALTNGDARETFTVSLDIPSGWDVDAGAPDDGDVFVPDLLVSLTAPKQCCATLDDPARGEPRPRVKRMAQTHVVAGTFLTDALCEKYGLEQIPLRVDSDREYVPLDLWRR